ncbi:MAG: response regulator [Dehalococcoidia bacterium]|nr:response regulator [Dehalococcoidia bacterium]
MHQDVVILVADDDEGHAALTCKSMKRAGINNPTMVFRDGEQLLDFLFEREPRSRLEEDTPYLVLLDLMMPRVNGIEVLRQIKSHPDLKRVPVVMLSSTDDPEVIDLCYNLGCSSYMVKPVDPKHYGEAVRKIGLYLTAAEIPPVRRRRTNGR